MESKGFKFDKYWGLLIILLAFILLILEIGQIYTVPTNMNYILMDIIAFISFISIGLKIYLTKKRNSMINVGSLLVFLSELVFLGALNSFPLTDGMLSLSSSLIKVNSFLFVSLILFVSGVIIFFIGKIKK